MWFNGYGNKRLQICSDELSSFRFKGVWGFFFSRNRILWFQSSSKDSLTRERVCDVRHSCYRYEKFCFRCVWKNFQCMYVSLSLCICVCVPSCRCDSCFTRNRFYAETDKFYAEKIIFDAHWRFADTSFLLCSYCSSLEILNCSLPFFCSYEIFADTSFLPLSFFENCRMELPSLLINWDLNCWLLFFSAHWRFELLRILLWKLPAEWTVDRTETVMQKCSLESELLR